MDTESSGSGLESRFVSINRFTIKGAISPPKGQFHHQIGNFTTNSAISPPKETISTMAVLWYMVGFGLPIYKFHHAIDSINLGATTEGWKPIGK